MNNSKHYKGTSTKGAANRRIYFLSNNVAKIFLSPTWEKYETNWKTLVRIRKYYCIYCLPNNAFQTTTDGKLVIKQSILLRTHGHNEHSFKGKTMRNGSKNYLRTWKEIPGSVASCHISLTESIVLSIGACNTISTEPTTHNAQPTTPNICNLSFKMKCASTALHERKRIKETFYYQFTRIMA